MSLSRPSFFGYGFVLLGAALGAFGLVQVGLVSVALGVAGISLGTKAISRVERYLPLALALGLFALALALPSGR